MSAPDRRQLVNRKHKKLSIRRQCALLGIDLQNQGGQRSAVAPAPTQTPLPARSAPAGRAPR